ncbi:MAG: hypothetical protein ACYTAN_03380 [Planctomycetota bacterium]
MHLTLPRPLSHALLRSAAHLLLTLPTPSGRLAHPSLPLPLSHLLLRRAAHLLPTLSAPSAPSGRLAHPSLPAPLPHLPARSPHRGATPARSPSGSADASAAAHPLCRALTAPALAAAHPGGSGTSAPRAITLSLCLTALPLHALGRTTLLRALGGTALRAALSTAGGLHRALSLLRCVFARLGFGGGRGLLLPGLEDALVCLELVL